MRDVNKTIMKQSKYLFLVMIFVVTLLSCNKNFLEVPDNGYVNRQSYVKDLNSMQDYMNGIHVLLSTSYGIHSTTAYPELIADNLKSIWSLNVHYNWSQVPDSRTPVSISTSMNPVWMDFYKIIRSCNFVIEDIDKYASEGIDKSKILRGQAYAIRAFLHFELSNIFAQSYKFTQDASHPGIPYITTSDITSGYRRQAVSEVYDNIITDLKEAISLLPPDASDIRFMNSSAAKAILARVYLFKEDFINAKDISVGLIATHPLMNTVDGYPADMFKNKPPVQTEILFQLTPVYKDGAISDFLGLYLEYDAYAITNDLAAILKEDLFDVRNTWAANTSGQWRIKKFPSAVAGGLGYDPLTDYYVPVLRSSEMFLTAAEASAKTNDEVNARLYLNAVRKRANQTVADVTATGASLMDSIYKERRKELCFEGLRMWDLQRWKKTVIRPDVIPGYQTTLPYPSNKAIAPIPVQDVNLMGLQQNVGY